MKVHAFLFGLLLSVHALQAGLAVPQIIHVSDPVRPDETVLVTGEAMGEGTGVELAPLPGAADVGPGKLSRIRHWESIAPLQSDARSLKFVVPKTWPQGAWACRVRRGDAVSEPVIINAPTAWWWNGDGGESASPGGWLRVFGKALNFGGESRVKLEAVDGRSICLSAREKSCYALGFKLPGDLAVGDYALAVHNGLGGDLTWRFAGTLTVRAPLAWKPEVFNVKDFGPKPAEALLSALEKARANGGGVVYLPRGRYPVKETITVPPNTILRGESTELVSLYWPDFEKPPAELITGADYVLESLSLYCQNHRNVVSDTRLSEHVALRKVRIRANCYFGIEEAGKEFRKRRGPASHTECGAGVELRGKNFEVTDCDIYASNKGVRVNRAKTGIIARNRIRYGGRGYNIENTDRLIFENNVVEGNNLLAIGNDISTFWTNYCPHETFFFLD